MQSENISGLPILLNLFISFISILAFIISNTEADLFRVWSAWIFGTILFVMQIIINHDKIILQSKKIIENIKNYMVKK